MSAFDFFAENDIIDRLVRYICRTYASISGRDNFLYRVSLYAIFEHDFTDAHQSYHI